MSKRKPSDRPAGLVEIYGLSDPYDGRIRYVGKARDSASRLAQHISDSRSRSTPVYQWLRSLTKVGHSPVMIVLCVCQEAHWQEVERDIIANYRLFSDDLLNVADGGNEPFCSQSVRQKNGRMAVSLRTKNAHAKRVYELKRAVGKLLRDGCVSEKSRAKLRYAAIRAPHLFGCWATL